MGYLIKNDYKQLIQIDNLNQIIGNDTSLLDRIESASIAELSSYLVNKYDLSNEFADTKQYVYGVVRKAKDRVYIDALPYSITQSYAVNNQVLYNGDVYICIVPSSAGPFNSLNWRRLGAQYDKFYVKVPNNEWEYYTEYSVGDVVFYKDKVYTANLSSKGKQPDTNSTIWGTGVAYSVAGNVYPNDTSKWIMGDSRNQQVLMRLIDIVLYHIHSRIAPHNIPDLRVKRYDDAINWLKRSSRGDGITCDLPMKAPIQGMRNRYGSALPKQNNNI